MAQIKTNNMLLRVGTKVLFVATLFFIWVIPFSFLYSSSLAIASIALYSNTEKTAQGEIDLSAAEILSIHFKDRARAFTATYNALEKQRLQNVERRQKNQLCHYYITEAGNNLLDLVHPFLTTRIQQIKDRYTTVLFSPSHNIPHLANRPL